MSGAEPNDLAETPPAEPVTWIANGSLEIKAKTWFEARAIACQMTGSTDVEVKRAK